MTGLGSSIDVSRIGSGVRLQQEPSGSRRDTKYPVAPDTACHLTVTLGEVEVTVILSGGTPEGGTQAAGFCAPADGMACNHARNRTGTTRREVIGVVAARPDKRLEHE